jgi:thymidylate kinase
MTKYHKKRGGVLKNYFWISIEGTDSVGKTTLLKEVVNFLRKKKLNCAAIKEFSDSSLGNLIKNIIKRNKFFSLGGNEHFPFSETLLLCSDFIYQFERAILRNTKRKRLFIVSDRGPHSFLTYQCLRIGNYYGIASEKGLKDWVRNSFFPVGMPNLVFLLTSPIKHIKGRIIRDDGFLKNGEVNFIKKVQNEYLKILSCDSHSSCLILENRDGDFNEIKRKVIQEIERKIKNLR